MFTELADNATALPMLNQQIIHLNTLVQNLSWNIPELEELLAPNIPPKDDMATSTPPTHTTDTQPNAPHDNMILNTTLDTENMEGTSTPIRDG